MDTSLPAAASSIQTQTAKICGRFVSRGLPDPNSAAFGDFLLGLRETWTACGLEWVRWFPRLRGATADAPSEDLLGSPWLLSSVSLWRSYRWEAGLPKYQPKRNALLCLLASVARHIDRLSDEDIGEHLLMLIGDDGGGIKREPYRWRSVPATVERGDRLWDALGAWPWVAFHGTPIPQWWRHARADAFLQWALVAQQRRLEQQASKANALIFDLAGGASVRFICNGQPV